MSKENKGLTRREFLRDAALAGGASVLALSMRVEASGEGEPLPFESGKYQTFPRLETAEGEPIMQRITIGTLGPDVDTIVGVDLAGDVETEAVIVHQPEEGEEVKETRVVFIKRVDVETVELGRALGGDRFDVYQISEYGGDVALGAMARKHAENTARKHQRPGVPELGIAEPNFVNPRAY